MRFRLIHRYTLSFILSGLAVLVVTSGTILYLSQHFASEMVQTASEKMEVELENQMEKGGKSLLEILARDLENPILLLDMETIEDVLSSVLEDEGIDYV